MQQKFGAIFLKVLTLLSEIKTLMMIEIKFCGVLRKAELYHIWPIPRMCTCHWLQNVLTFQQWLRWLRIPNIHIWFWSHLFLLAWKKEVEKVNLLFHEHSISFVILNTFRCNLKKWRFTVDAVFHRLREPIWFMFR